MTRCWWLLHLCRHVNAGEPTLAPERAARTHPLVLRAVVAQAGRVGEQLHEARRKGAAGGGPQVCCHLARVAHQAVHHQARLRRAWERQRQLE